MLLYSRTLKGKYMQRLRENHSIDVHRIRHKHITWASISAREGVVKIFENHSPFWPKKSVFIFNGLPSLITFWSEVPHMVTYRSLKYKSKFDMLR